MKPQDVVVILKLQSLDDVHNRNSENTATWSQRFLAAETGLSLSEVNMAYRRLKESRLLSYNDWVIRASLLEFLVHGLKYVFPAEVGRTTGGMPTGYAAAPLRDHFLMSANEPPPVWPDASGTVRGLSMKPLYKTVPMAAKKDSRLYEYLVLIDAIRAGRARERNMAAEMLQERLG